jgi:hypothetical protein
MRQQKEGRAGVKSRGWPEIGSDGDILLTPYVPQGITGIAAAAADDDDDDDCCENLISWKVELVSVYT